MGINKILLIIGGIIVSFILVLVMSYATNANYGHKAETEIAAAYKHNQNILSQYNQKIGEAAQIPAMQRDDLKEIVTAAMVGRYGAEGSKGVFQWIKEQNPSVDSAVYKELQQIIVAGRNKFENGQLSLIDKKRAYETNIGYVYKGFWLRLAGYPKKTMADYKIITLESVDETFKKGKETGPIKLR